ncbi:MAG: tol-pal system-associated acyl-CoA thioesterase [Hyphomicrobiales bacterium]
MTISESGWPDIAGRITEGLHVLPIRVYFEDTDFSGAVYHANYVKFCERGRTDCLRLMGIHHRDLHEVEGGSLVFVVRRMECDFLKPARIDDLLEVSTVCLETGGARMVLGQRITREETLLFKARVTVALIGADGRPRRFPGDLANRFKALQTKPE